MVTTYINKVSFTDVSQLATSYIKSPSEIFLPFEAQWTELCMTGLARLTVTESIENHQRMQSAELEAIVLEPLIVGDRKLAFLCTDIKGNRILLGGPDAPYPLVLCTESHGSSPTEVRTTLKVTYRNASLFHAV